MEKDRIKTLLDKYRRGDITEEERTFLENWYIQYGEPGHDAYDTNELLEDAAAVKAGLRRTVLRPKRRKTFFQMAAAAAVVVLVGGLYLYRNDFTPQATSNFSSVAGISPGGNKATLTLTGGGTIHLSSEKEGIMINGGKLLYSDGTAIGHPSLPDKLPAGYAILATPRGGQYQLRLPDGSRVWLNASSILKYPLSFEGLKERRLTLSGEAYFEVAKDPERPFLVSAGQQTAEVLGTRFNISSYASEQAVKTTLLEGSLKVTPIQQKAKGESDSRLLRPGQQSTMLDGGMVVKQVDTDEAVAWKNGYFQFNNKNLETALTELGRWYDVEIEYRNNKIRKQELAGTISKYADISQVLEKMELTGLMQFRVEGRRIIVE